MKKTKYIVAVDEAGRGPLAGPVVVGGIGVKITKRNEKKIGKILKGIKDSKKLTPSQREKWYKILQAHFECRFAAIGNEIIDRIGVQRAVERGIKRLLKKFSFTPDLVLLDGLLKAPENYHQKTIIKGDEKNKFISAASIIAKVERDKKMLSFHKKFPWYGFDRHKGYGTIFHYNMINELGISKVHRKSFLQKKK